MYPTVELQLRSGVKVLTTKVRVNKLLRIGAKVRFTEKNSSWWTIEAIHASGQWDQDPSEFIYCGFGS